jgi:hypothetical protein
MHRKKLEKDDAECDHDNPTRIANSSNGLLNRLACRPIFSPTEENIQASKDRREIETNNDRIRTDAKKLGYDRNNDMKKDHANENIQKSSDVIFKTKNQTERKNEQKQSKNSRYHTNILT